MQLTLKTDKGQRTLRLDPSIYDDLTKQKVSVGDVIHIEANSGAVKRMGRCDLYAGENDLETDEWVPMPKGEVHKTKELVQHATLYDFDKAGASQTRQQDALTTQRSRRQPQDGDHRQAEAGGRQGCEPVHPGRECFGLVGEGW